MNERITSLCNFLNTSHSVYHAIAGLEKTLLEAGFTRLSERDAWELLPGGKYYLIRGGTSLLAFRIPQGAPRGFLMSASHSDRPTFKVKEHSELVAAYTRLEVERYGGMLMYTWLDRPLSLAGRVMVETENGIESRLVDLDRDLLMMPNMAIHMNRQINDGYKWNPAVDTIPLVGSKDAKGKIRALIKEEVGGRILGHDLYLYIRDTARVWGIDNEYISSSALVDLSCAWACTQGLLNAGESGSIPVLCVFDTEEVGSASVQGAGSTLLSDTLERICQARGLDLHRMLAQSFMISADNGHALHPNHPELADPANAPILGQGPVLKYNSNLLYCTDGLATAVFRKVCEKAGVKVQSYYNRPDIPGGSTLGRISLAHVSVPTADVGLPQLAMHSCFETAAVADAESFVDAMTAYYGATLEMDGGNIVLK